jgi:hypothetical protein
MMLQLHTQSDARIHHHQVRMKKQTSVEGVIQHYHHDVQIYQDQLQDLFRVEYRSNSSSRALMISLLLKKSREQQQ